jgi:hypothetical protein
MKKTLHERRLLCKKWGDKKNLGVAFGILTAPGRKGEFAAAPGTGHWRNLTFSIQV